MNIDHELKATQYALLRMMMLIARSGGNATYDRNFSRCVLWMGKRGLLDDPVAHEIAAEMRLERTQFLETMRRAKAPAEWEEDGEPWGALAVELMHADNY